MKIVIRAGGVGTRLWPLSRNSRPKQFHALEGQRSLLQAAFDRVLPLVDVRDVYVSAPSALRDLLRAQLPELPEENLILEPARRDTAAAVGLESVIIAARAPGSVVASIGSDHVIGDDDGFRSLLTAASEAVEALPEHLLLLGVKPSRPETGYGYIQLGSELMSAAGQPVYEVAGFKEKPDAATATAYVESGDYLWNSNMFTWRVDTLLDLYERFKPEMTAALRQIQQAVDTPDFETVLERIYGGLERTAVDYAILEKAPRIAAMAADIGWADVGSWSALGDVLPADAQGNIVKGTARLVDCTNCTVVGGGERLKALIGLDGVVVVETPDAVLVCSKESAQAVKRLVEELGAEEALRRFVE